MKIFKYILQITPLLPLLLSCSNEEEHIRPGFEVEDGSSLLQLRFEMPKSKGTYAPAQFQAYPSEKEVKSIAIFTKNQDENSGGIVKRGAFNKFLSTDEMRSATGLYEPLEGGNGTFTTTIKIKSDGWDQDKVQVILIANYAENGLTQKLEELATFDALSNLTTETLTDNPQAPLLMIGAKEVTLTNGGRVDETFDLTRLVSRIDVKNLADVSGFTLTSAQLVNPRKYSFMLGGNAATPNIPVADGFTAIAANNGEDPDPTKVDCLYTYETDNANPATATAVAIKGDYNGIQLEKIIQLKHPDKDGVTGLPIVLDRNYRYLINILPAQDPTEVTWEVKVAPWADGEIIEVNPPSVVPEIIDLDFGSNGNTNDWNPANRVYRFNNHIGDKITFTIRSMYTTNVSLDFKYHHNAAGLFGLEDRNSQAFKDFYKLHDPIVTYACVEQKVEIVMPQLLSQPTGPVAIKLSMVSPNNRYNKTDITFLYMKDYDGTGLEPVLVGGYYWAPINVGAITDEGNALDVTHMGNIYQFARNEYVCPISWNADDTYVGDEEPGPADYDTGTSSSYQKYITKKQNENEGLDWLKRDDNKRDYRNNRWSPTINDSPCPSGWRVPTTSEWQKIIDISKDSNNRKFDNMRLGILSDEKNNKYLYMPRTPFRATDGKIVRSQGLSSAQSHYWASNGYDTNPYSYIIHSIFFKEIEPEFTMNIHTEWPAHAMAIRCIQQDVGDSRNGG